jgi:hypothetical protein
LVVGNTLSRILSFTMPGESDLCLLVFNISTRIKYLTQPEKKFGWAEQNQFGKGRGRPIRNPPKARKLDAEYTLDVVAEL